jgi:hypothetical protein
LLQVGNHNAIANHHPHNVHDVQVCGALGDGNNQGGRGSQLSPRWVWQGRLLCASNHNSYSKNLCNLHMPIAME